MTLKIGDKVRVADNPYTREAHPRLRPGRVYRVSHVYNADCVALEGYDRRAVAKSRLEKIEPEPKFRAGDRVRALETSAAQNIVAGRAYTVRKVKASIVDPDGLLIFEGRNQGVYARRFEKIEEEPPRPLGLRPGDKVVNLKTGREGLVLKGPISGELKVYDQKPPIRDAVPAAALEGYEFHYPGTYDVWRRVQVEGRDFVKAQPW